MKWGRRGKSSLITRVFPVSWFSKFTKKDSDSENHSTINREKLDFPNPNSSSLPLPAGLKKRRFYSMDGDEDDAYWRFSFRDDDKIIEGRRSTGGINPNQFDSDHEFQIPKKEENWNFDDLVLEIKKLKEKQPKEKLNQEKRAELERGPNYEDEQTSNSVERDIFAIEREVTEKPKENIWKSPVSNLRNQQNIEEDIALKARNLEERESLKDIKVKTESRGKKIKQHKRVKSYSPRTECKIRALEEMRKERMKLKKGRIGFENFAVVKSSFNPYQDFRDSMVEMITEKGIRRPEELEELLACYLTLNRDEYHNLIIKVFRQVWFDLNGI